MTKNLLKASLWGILTLSLFYSCRTDSVTTEQTAQTKEKIAVFERFEKENNIIKPIAGNDQGTSSSKYVSYSYPFALIIYNFLQTHPDYAKQIEKEVGTIRLDAVSQTFGEAKKSVIFPVTNNEGKVVAIWGGVINENRNYVSFYTLNNNSQEINTIKAEFQNYYDQKERKLDNNAIASIKGLNPIALKPEAPKDPPVKEKEIPEVVITVPKCDCDVPKIPGAGGPDPNGINGNNPAGGMNGGPTTHGGAGNGTPSDGQKDPCSKTKAAAEKATKDYKDPAVKDAKAATQAAYNNDPADAKNEHVTMIENNNGQLSQGKTFSGGAGSVTGLATSNTVGDIHNHNDDLPPSPGDVYGLMEGANSLQNYRTKFVYTQQGTEYALVVTDIDALRNFLKTYPPNRSVRNGRTVTNFPTNINDEYNDTAFAVGGYDRASFEIALPYILDKYNAGISLTKMDSSGSFKKINVESNTTNGTTTYTQKPCN